MKKFTLFLLAAFPIILFAQTAKTSFAFTHVNVIDVKNGSIKKDFTVVITGNRITAVGKKVSVPKNAEIINAKGKYLIPGLWDMHVHTLDDKSGEIFFPLFIANGVTGVRDMGTSVTLNTVNKLKQDIASGKLIGPTIVAAGKILDGPQPKDLSASIAVATASEGRNAVRLLKREGVDFIKVYNGLPREAYFAIADEAKKQYLPFAGHVPISVTAAEASNAGQKSIEHLFGVHEGCAENENELRENVINYAAKHPGYRRILFSADAVDSYNQKKASELIKLFAKNKTWQCPTLVVRFSASYSDNSILVHAHDALTKYIYPELREEWNSADSARQNGYKGYYPKLKQLYSEDLRVIAQMHRFGVPILAGTDALAVPNILPGFSLYDELALLVKARLTPLQALQTATINPAKFLAIEKESGTIEKGKLADLVLLDANPLVDVQNAQKINAVVAHGRYFSRKHLDKLLADVEASANKRIIE